MRLVFKSRRRFVNKGKKKYSKHKWAMGALSTALSWVDAGAGQSKSDGLSLATKVGLLAWQQCVRGLHTEFACRLCSIIRRQVDFIPNAIWRSLVQHEFNMHVGDIGCDAQVAVLECVCHTPSSVEATRNPAAHRPCR